MPEKTLIVIARITARPGREDEVRELLRGLVGPTRAEPGCIRYVLHHNLEDPSDFTFIEEWTGEAALEEHLKTPHIESVGPAFDEMATLDLRKYEVVE